MSQNKLLNSPFTLPSGAVLKNRIAKSALTERLSKSDMLPNKLHHQLYRHWASNGSGLLVSGNIIVHKNYLESTGNIVIEQDTPKEPFKAWVNEVTKTGTHFWAQLSHAGRQSSRFSTFKPVSPSNVQLKKLGLFARPRAMTNDEIEETIGRFLFAAAFCKSVGFTGLQIHAAHGYLISQFLSPKTNKRNDKWGGSLENRSRMLTEIISLIKSELGSDFPISVKLNSADFQKGAFTEEDSLKVIKILEELKIDLLEISGGTYERSAMFGLGLKQSTLDREAYFLDFARKVRKISSLPLMVTGGFRTSKFCENTLEKNLVDVVGFGRPYLMDHSFPKGFLDDPERKVVNPVLKILDKKNQDAAEAGYYDLQIKNLAHGRPLRSDYSGLRLAAHIGAVEMKKGIINNVFG